MSSEQKKTQKDTPSTEIAESSFLSEIFNTLARAMLVVIIFLCLAVKVCTVSGNSMMNTLSNGEKLLISDLFYTPKEGDIVVFHDTNNLNQFVVKRIIATGDKWVRIDFDRCEVYVSQDNIFESGELVDESHYVYLDTGSYKKSEGIVDTYVPEGYLFVMGDNRNNSLDSRSEEVGLVDERSIVGKLLLRFFPLNKIGTVE